MVAKPNTLMSTPVHLARWAGGKMSPMMAWAMGIMAPAPEPLERAETDQFDHGVGSDRREPTRPRR